MPATIPAALLDALGGVVSAPVETAGGLPVGRRQWAALMKSSPRVHLAVEPSMPGLLQALAKQYGAKLEPGEVPTWRRRDAMWRLTSRSGLARMFTEDPMLPPLVPPDRVIFFHVPALSADMGRLEALVAVIAWLVSR